VHIVAVLVGAFIMAAPLLYLVSMSLMTSTDVRAFPPNLIPPEIRWRNYVEAVDFLALRTIMNSLVFSLGVVVLQLTLSMTAGFALAKLRFRGATTLTLIFAASLFIPGPITLVPTYIVAREFDLINTYAGLILPIAAQTGFGTLLFRQFFINLPDPLLSAARVDGANWFQVFARIAVPLTGPATAAYCAVTFLTAWNLYVWPLVVAPRPEMRVLPLALAPLATTPFVPLNVAMAAVMISTIPVLIAFVIAQRAFIRGLSGTGLD
jgi:multiple sugar transport system permease protein